jgi:D-3-phosphoglycerate dehydrogenase / 2-oxoglutarate reductase
VSFRELLETSDVITLHVDGKVQNQDLFGEDEIRAMKDGACLINLSRGFVVDHEALARHLKSGKLGGAAVDVFPQEPESGGAFSSPLKGLPNVILTPHIGGSTEEAQQNIGQFVSARMIDYFTSGNSLLSVNLPHCHLDYEPGSHRLMHIHHNVPGILSGKCSILAGRLDMRFTTSIGIAMSSCWLSCGLFRIRFGCGCREWCGVRLRRSGCRLQKSRP